MTEKVVETRVALLESYTKNNSKRLEQHKKDFNERIDRIVDTLEKVEKILWEDGLVNTVKENSKYIKSQCSQKNKNINFIYRTLIFIILSFIAVQVGLK